MYDILKARVDDLRYLSHTDTTAASPDPKQSGLWLFTDPVAQAIYAQQGKRDRLREDISTYVMYGGQWSPDELQFKHEVRRLLCGLADTERHFRPFECSPDSVSGHKRRRAED